MTAAAPYRFASGEQQLEAFDEFSGMGLIATTDPATARQLDPVAGKPAAEYSVELDVERLDGSGFSRRLRIVSHTAGEALRHALDEGWEIAGELYGGEDLL